MAAAVILPVASVSENYTVPDPRSVSGPWWDCFPPAPPVVYKTRVVYRQAETLIESIPAAMSFS